MLTLLMLLLIAVPAMTQTHAPLPEQCKADNALWMSPSAHTPSVQELSDRSDEMEACAAVFFAQDGGEGVQEGTKMQALHNYFVAWQLDRMQRYLRRHGEMTKFVAEQDGHQNGQ